MRALNTVVLTLVSAACLCAAREGETLQVDLANEVLGNAQVSLPVPYKMETNTPANRDMGTYTEHPIDSRYEVEVSPSSLQTTNEQNGVPPNIKIVRMLMRESGNITEPPPGSRTGDTPAGQSVRRLTGMVNPTAASTVHGWTKHKYQVLKAWMDAQSDSSSLMAIHASGEVLYAGCNESTIQSKYDQIIAASGGTQTIVMAAEVSPFHDDLAWWYTSGVFFANVNTQRTTFLSRMQNDYGCSGCVEHWAETRKDCTNAAHGYCTSPAEYQFANSGFIMGPIGDIDLMLSEMARWDSTLERLVNQYFLNNPDKVALDYTGDLVMSLHNLVPSGVVQVQTDGSGKSFLNLVTNKPVCFLHGDGNSFSRLREMAAELM